MMLLQPPLRQKMTVMVESTVILLLLVGGTRNNVVAAAATTFTHRGSISSSNSISDSSFLCEPLRVSGCQSLGYNHTLLPNLVGMRNQLDAHHAMSSFKPLLQYGCSSQLRILLCGFYAPMCSPITAGPVPPCQRLCFSVRQRCSPIMANFGYPWPSGLNCSSLPVANTPSSMCMEGPGEVPLLPLHHPTAPTSLSGTTPCTYPHCPCRGGHVVPVIPFNAEDKEFASVWMAIWSVVCCGVTFFTLVSFFLSRTRYGFLEAGAFRYPDRCGVHMVACYCMVSAGYLLRLGLGPTSVSPCLGATIPGAPSGEGASMGSFGGLQAGGLLPSDHESDVLGASCVLVFLLLYYFTNAAAMWWLMLCGCWLAGEWRGWRHDRLLAAAVWMHLAAWGEPALLTIAVLTKRVLTPDELTGTCYPGHGSSLTLVQWVLLPQLLLLLLGTTLLLLTFACLWREHSAFTAAEALLHNRTSGTHRSPLVAPASSSSVTPEGGCQQPQQLKPLQQQPSRQLLQQLQHHQQQHQHHQLCDEGNPQHRIIQPQTSLPQNRLIIDSADVQAAAGTPTVGNTAALTTAAAAASASVGNTAQGTPHTRHPHFGVLRGSQYLQQPGMCPDIVHAPDCRRSGLHGPESATDVVPTAAAMRRPAQKAARVGVIAMLYMLPAICQVGALFYESLQRDKWLSDASQRPSIQIFMFKIFMSLAPGIMLSLFLANNRVMHSWRQLGRRLYAIHGGDKCQTSDHMVVHGGTKGCYARNAATGGLHRTTDCCVKGGHLPTVEQCYSGGELSAARACGGRKDATDNICTNKITVATEGGESGVRGLNGPCHSSTGCESQESGVYTSQSKQNRRVPVENNYDIETNFNRQDYGMVVSSPHSCYHHSFEAIYPTECQVETNYDLTKQSQNLTNNPGQGFNGYHDVPQDPCWFQQSQYPVLPEQQLLRYQQQQQQSYPQQMQKKKFRKKAPKKNHRRASETRL